jgi:hypothetical protein
MGFIHLQIEWNPWLGGYRPQIPVLSALYPQLNLLDSPRKKSWVCHWCNAQQHPSPKMKIRGHNDQNFYPGCTQFWMLGSGQYFRCYPLAKYLSSILRKYPWYPSTALTLARLVQQWVLLCSAVHTVCRLMVYITAHLHNNINTEYILEERVQKACTFVCSTSTINPFPFIYFWVDKQADYTRQHFLPMVASQISFSHLISSWLWKSEPHCLWHNSELLVGPLLDEAISAWLKRL